MNNLKVFFEQVNEIVIIRGYVTRDRFIDFANAKSGVSESEAEKLWKVWDFISTLNSYQLSKLEDDVIDLAMSVARDVHSAICNGAHIHWRDNETKTPKWRVYYRCGTTQRTTEYMDVDLREKHEAIKYAMLLQREDVEVIYRLDFYQSVQVYNSDKAKVSIYDGDIIFCNVNDRLSWSDVNGVYVCVDGCYKRLMYTPGRGYLRRGEPDFEQDRDGEDCRYNSHVFNSYNKTFRVVGNIYVDNSVLIEDRGEKE